MSQQTPGPWYVYGTEQEQAHDITNGLPVLIRAKKDFSLMVAHAEALKAIAKATSHGEDA